MAEIIEMPKLSDTMSEGVIASWTKKVGETVESGELLAEIETDKATMDFESFFDGVLLYIGAKEGEAIDIGGLLAIIGEKGEDVSEIIASFNAKASAAAETPAPEQATAPAQQPAAPVTEAKVAVAAPVTQTTKLATAPSGGSNGSSRLKASPLAKAMAKELGIDLKQVPGTGDGGRIIKRDVESYKENPPATRPTVPFAAPVGTEGFHDEKVSQMRKTIARRLSQSKFTAPHFYLTMEINMENAVAARKSMNEISPVKLSFNDLIIKATAAALRQHPKVNGAWMEDHIRYFDHIHIGMAVAVADGLVVPVLRFADSMSLSQISATAQDLAGRARERKLGLDEMTGNTFTISNLGMFGIEEFTAIINSPDACILAVGGIKDVPVVRDGQVVPGKTMKVTLSCDHRVVDGAIGSAFLKTLKNLLENPVRILI